MIEKNRIDDPALAEGLRKLADEFEFNKDIDLDSERNSVTKIRHKKNEQSQGIKKGKPNEN